MTRRLYLWGAAALLLILAAGLAVAQATHNDRASSAAASTSNASQQTPAAVQIGNQLYAANCATCHGKDGQGGQYHGIRGMSRFSFDRFKSLILYGRERMPGYAKTGLSTSNNLGSLGSNGYLGNTKAPTDQQIQDLLAYLKTLPGANGGGFFGGGDD